MSKRPLTILLLLAVLGVLWSARQIPVSAAPAPQPTPFLTPTPGPDGRIVYIVQEEDTLWRIAAITVGDATIADRIKELIELNRLNPENPIVVPNQELLLGFAGPAQALPTLAPAATPTPLLLTTPDAEPGTGMLCVLLFNDRNGDAFRQDDEPAIPGGAISISSPAASASETGTTTARLDADGEVLRDCFEELPEGSYNVSVAVPEAYNPTTTLNYTLDLMAGDETLLDFGAQLSTVAQAESPPPEEGGRSPLLGLLGGILLLAGAAMGLFAGLMRRRSF
jgi:hypothetical protein